MADTLTPEKRSQNMAAIRSSDTKPEEIVRKYLFAHGLRYRKNVKNLPGKPDVVLAKYKVLKIRTVLSNVLPLNSSASIVFSNEGVASLSAIAAISLVCRVISS